MSEREKRHPILESKIVSVVKQSKNKIAPTIGNKNA